MDWLTSFVGFLVERPLLLLLAAALPLLPPAFLSRIFPSRRLLAVAAIPALASLILILFPNWLPAVLILDGLLLLTLLADFLTLPRGDLLGAERAVQHVASQGKPHDIEMAVINRSSRTIRVEIQDDLPDEFETDQREYALRLNPGSRTAVEYRIQALRRGLFQMECLHVRTHSWLGLWVQYLKLPAQSAVHVYPDMQQLGQYELLARTNRLSLLGMRRSRRIGNENEFERLRNYNLDDDHRHIDWRASARRRELTVRDYQANQNQQVLFMLDCGRLMTGLSGRVPLLDHALNALLMLAWIALSRGDSVGLVLFSDRIHSFVPPRTGTRHINRLLHVTFNQFADYSESRYDLAFQCLSQRVRKRSLVILMTNVMDEVNTRIVQDYLFIQAGRHLPLAVFLRDEDLYGLVNPAVLPVQPADLQQDWLEEQAIHGVAREIAASRENAIATLAIRGVLTLDVPPGGLTAPLVNRYLEIKARGLL